MSYIILKSDKAERLLHALNYQIKLLENDDGSNIDLLDTDIDTNIRNNIDKSALNDDIFEWQNLIDDIQTQIENRIN